MCPTITPSTLSFVNCNKAAVEISVPHHNPLNPQLYSGTIDAFKKILAKEGVLGFYRGVLPNLLQVAPAAGLRFGVYSTCLVAYQR